MSDVLLGFVCLYCSCNDAIKLKPIGSVLINGMVRLIKESNEVRNSCKYKQTSAKILIMCLRAVFSENDIAGLFSFFIFWLNAN